MVETNYIFSEMDGVGIGQSRESGGIFKETSKIDF